MLDDVSNIDVHLHVPHRPIGWFGWMICCLGYPSSGGAHKLAKDFTVVYEIRPVHRISFSP